MPSAIPQIGELLGHYRLVEKIGAGGMGVVYRAHDERLDRDVAVKVLPADGFADENARKKFHREALTLSKLSHGNIANIFDFDTQESVDFLVMEYVCGTTMAEKLTKGALPEKEVLRLGVQIVKALVEAHEHGVVHCDLKPGNIMVTTSQQQVKLLDFGLAKRLRIPGTATTVTLSHLYTFGGTLPYMSPEQLLGKVPDFRSDIYSVGAVLYEMATGRRLFEEKVSTVLADEILHKLPRPPTLINPSISTRFQDVILKCLEKDSDDRYQSVKELAVDLRHLAAPSSVPVEITQLTYAARQRKRRNKLILRVLAIVALLVFISLTSWYSRGKPRKQQIVLMGEFYNRTDDRVFDDVIPELLTINLEQSGFISVFPSSRRSETLKLMELGPTASIDEATGREICQREALNAVILGSITKLGSRYVLTARALSPAGQRLASTEDVVANAGDLPASLDKISKYLRKALGESKHEIQSSSVPVADVTSSSLLSIRSFLAGKKQLYAGSPQGAKASFERALELDPSFAMAHEYLGIAYLHQGNPVRAEEELKKTLPMLDHVTEQERRKILGDYSVLRRDFDQAIVHFRLLKGLRPRDPAPSLNLAQCYAAKLNFDSALEETKAALEIEPTAGPQNNLAEIYLLKGDIPNALKTAAKIVQKNSENVRGMENLGWAYLLNNQVAEARETFERMVSFGGDAESRGRSALADVALSSGRYKEAKQELEAGMAVDRRLGNLFAAEKKQIAFSASSLGEPGNWSLSDAQRKHEQAGNDPQLILLEGLYYARAKRRSELARNFGTLDLAVKSNPVPTLHSFREMLAAKLALLDSNPGAAVAAAKRAVDMENSSLAWQVLAESYAAARQPAEAISSYEKVLARGAERSQSYDAPAYHELIEMHYRLGVLYQNSDEKSKARTHLEQFLKSWSHPEGKPSIYNDAKARLRRLSAAEAQAGTPAPAM
jgi:serine/threonine protein kinase/tetratricopeptide (TPR) repeat protein